MPPAVTTSPPRALFLAAAVIGLEAVGAVAFAVVEVANIRSDRVIVGAGAAALLLGYGAFLATICRGVARGRRWSRGAGVATQLLQGLMAWSFREGQTWWVGLLLGSSAILTLVCLLLPSATAVFTAESGSDADPSHADPPP